MTNRLLLIFKFLFVPFLLLFCTTVFSQTATISGKVLDSDGNPVIGTNVLVVGTTVGTVTDIDGNYSLDIPVGEVDISFSFMGYLTETQTVNISENSNRTIDIILIEDLMQLDDIIVIGYGTQKKSDLTGAVASVSSEEIVKTTNSSIEGAIQGRAAGVRVSSTVGSPGSEMKVYIRGVTSINESGALWVVDGVVADPKTINPNDVESIEILKDAGATAIYGAAGGNGVVIVNTKKGEPGKTRATFNVTHGWQTVPDSRLLDMATGPEFGAMYTEIEKLSNKHDTALTFQDFENLPTYNYQKEVLRTAPISDYHLGVSGGNEQSSFSLGLGYTQQQGVLRNTDYSKITARLNSDHKINDWLTVGERMSVTRQKWGGFEEWEFFDVYHSPILMSLQYPYFVPVYIDTLGNPADEKNEYTNWSRTSVGTSTNPVSRIETTHKGKESISGRVSAFLRIEPLKGLKIESRVSGDITSANSFDFDPYYNVTGTNQNLVTAIYRGYDNYKSWQLQNVVSYENTIASEHNFSVMIGNEASEAWSQYTNGKRENLINEDPEMWYFDASLNDTLPSQIIRGSAWERASVGYFSRLSYNYKSMILAQFNVRRDEDSRFKKDNRVGIFPSYSVGFKFTELNVVKSNLSFLSFGKIRWSSGSIGNNPLSDYTYYSTVSNLQVLDYSFNNSSTNTLGAARNEVVNSGIHWEAVKTQNLGLDLTFLQNRLSLTTEWFHRANDGMIMQVDVPAHAGFIITTPDQEGGTSKPYSNVGKMINKGFEVQIGWKNSIGKINYAMDFNYTYVNTVAKDLPDTIRTGRITGINGYMAWTVPNGGLSEYFGYEVERIFGEEDYDETLEVITNQPYYDDPESGERIYAQPNARPGDYKFKDRNGDNRLDDKDIGPIGNPVPKHDIGFNLNLNYGWFDFNLFLQGVLGFKNFNAQKLYQFNKSMLVFATCIRVSELA
jgi:TonB-linked SusC/RagA family outer membrane protein